MTLDDAISAMQAWNNLRNQQGLATIEGYFNSGNSFVYQYQSVIVQNNQDLHVYMGVENNALILITVPAQFDNQASLKSVPGNQNNPYIEKDTLVTLSASNNGNGSGMPINTALERIGYWNNQATRNTWLSANITNLFQAIELPESDMLSGDTHNCFFALKPDGSATGGYYAELIVENVNAQSKAIYMDTATPVPPFPPTGLYLLTLI